MVIKPKRILSDSNQPQVVVKLFLSKRTLTNVGLGFLEICSVSRNSKDGRTQTCASLEGSNGRLDNPSYRVSQSGRVIWTGGGGVIERIIRVDARINA
jgi:hypothetical protein